MKKLILSFLLLTSFFIGKKSYASFSESFESGTLSGNGWTASLASISSSSPCSTSPNPVSCLRVQQTGSTGYAYKLDSVSNAFYQFRFYTTLPAYDGTVNSLVEFRQSTSTNVGYFDVIRSGSNANLRFTGASTLTVKTSVSLNAWHIAYFEYSQALNSIRYKFDSDVNWSSWQALMSTDRVIYGLKFLNTESAASSVYFDDIQMTNTLGSNTIAFNSLQVGSSTIPLQSAVIKDFDYWSLLWSGTSTELYNITVQYSDAPNTISFVDSDHFLGIAGQSMEAALLKETKLHDGDWYATANLFNSTGDLVYYTDVSFRIDSQSTTTINTDGYPNNTSYVSLEQSTSTSILQSALSGTMSVFSQFFPFNIGVNFYSSWLDSASTSLPSELSFLSVTDGNGNIYYSMNSITGGNASTSMLLFGPAVFNDNSATQNFFANMRILSKYAMWFLFIFGMIKRGEHYYQILNTTK